MEKDINPVGAKLHALQMALTNKQMVEMVHQMEDPKSFLDANYIPMAAHERSGGLANVILVKINGVTVEGTGPLAQFLDKEGAEILKFFRLLATEYNYHYIKLISHSNNEFVNIGLLVHHMATDMDILMALKSITAGMDIFPNSSVFVLGFDLEMDPAIPCPEVVNMTANNFYYTTNGLMKNADERRRIWAAIKESDDIDAFFGEIADEPLEIQNNNLESKFTVYTRPK